MGPRLPRGRVALHATVGDDARRAFADEGFLVVESGLPDTVLDRARRDAERLIAARPFDPESPDRVQDAWRASRAVHQVAAAPAVLDVLADLYGRAPRPFQTLNFAVGTEQAAHADTVHFNSQPSGFMCGVWVALEDIDERSGPVFYLPGTHRWPELTPADWGAPAGTEHYDRYEAHVAEQVEAAGIEPVPALLRTGQALVWAGNLLHGGAPRLDPERSRHSQVTHYFFEGCRYWTPLRSTADHIEWRHPRFVATRTTRRPLRLVGR
ncbi:MAG: phytanoyl-CoA dioxygenase family protein [Acidimicrobiales bacterium]|nr:phytanoyl-CoA dioxygenase family protein [Acidimicrobiales bacterium]